MKRRLTWVVAIVALGLAVEGLADQVIPDDLVIQGDLCAGLDCLGDYPFNGNTVALRENNTRIRFEDTSATPGFTTQSWWLAANQSASGGQNRFSIDTGLNEGQTVIRLVCRAEANDHGLVVNASGIGFGTPTPQSVLHALRDDTPGFRLEQSSALHPAQSWDIAGNEANFFIRDVTGGSRLSFRIVPGAPTNSLTADSAGRVGVGTLEPTARVHAVTAPFGVSDLTKGAWLVESNTAGATSGIRLQAQGNTQVVHTNTASSRAWRTTAGATGFERSEVGAPAAWRMTASGDMSIAGTLSSGSSRAIKQGITPVQTEQTLRGVRALPVATWSYNNDANNARHIGPMAEDFYGEFHTGADPRYLAPSDVAAGSLAAMQALLRRHQEQQERITKLSNENHTLRVQVERLERLASVTQEQPQ